MCVVHPLVQRVNRALSPYTLPLRRILTIFPKRERRVLCFDVDNPKKD